jgi:uncharacterized membrane protein
VEFSRWQMMAAGTRTTVGAVIGAAVAGVSLAFTTWPLAIVLGWAAATVLFTGSIWLTVAPMDAAATRTHAVHEDPSRAMTDTLLLGATLISLVDVGFVLVKASEASGARQGWLAGLALGSVALSWLLIHTVFTLRYARLYYGGVPGGVDFNQKEDQRYSDFAYLAFSVGMTFQVSDTNLTAHPMRASVLRHALLSFLFGSVILATTINLIVSLSSTSR